MLAPRHIVKQLLPELGILSQGFCWEFVARVWVHDYSVEEMPITHRPRAAGQTQVYRLRKLPGIGWTHVTGVMQQARCVFSGGNGGSPCVRRLNIFFVASTPELLMLFGRKLHSYIEATH